MRAFAGLINYPLKKSLPGLGNRVFGSRQGLKDFTETTTIIRVIFFVAHADQSMQA